MKITVFFSLLAFFAVSERCVAQPQKLVRMAVTLQPKSSSGLCYVSLRKGKAYTEKEAIANKADIDFVYQTTQDGKNIKREFYNLSGKDIELPPDLAGSTVAGLTPLSWDESLVDKCNTTADWERMAGSYTNNSFTFYGTFANNDNGAVEKNLWAFQDAKGKRGLFKLTKGEDESVKLDVKMQP